MKGKFTTTAKSIATTPSHSTTRARAEARPSSASSPHAESNGVEEGAAGFITSDLRENLQQHFMQQPVEAELQHHSHCRVQPLQARATYDVTGVGGGCGGVGAPESGCVDGMCVGRGAEGRARGGGAEGGGGGDVLQAETADTHAGAQKNTYAHTQSGTENGTADFSEVTVASLLSPPVSPISSTISCCSESPLASPALASVQRGRERCRKTN